MPGPIKFKLGVCVSHDEYMNPIVFGAIQCLFGSKLSKKGDFVRFCEIVLVNTISPDCLVRSSLNLVCVFPMMSTWTLLFLVQIQDLFGSKLRKIAIINTTDHVFTTWGTYKPGIWLSGHDQSLGIRNTPGSDQLKLSTSIWFSVFDNPDHVGLYLCLQAKRQHDWISSIVSIH